jgi:diguanylate cyclase (GGDEF)-like protein
MKSHDATRSIAAKDLPISWVKACQYQGCLMAFCASLMFYYANFVCEYVRATSLLITGLLISTPIVLISVLRFMLIRLLFASCFQPTQLARIKTYQNLDLAGWILVCSTLTLHNYVVLGFPLASGVKLTVGFIALAILANATLRLDVSYNRLHTEHQPADCKFEHDEYESLVTRLNWLVLFASIAIMAVLILLVRSSISHLQSQNTEALMEVYHHIIFVMLSCATWVMILTFKYGRNLKTRLKQQLTAFSRPLDGDYSVSLPAITRDEISQIALGTNDLAAKMLLQRQKVEAFHAEAMLDPLTGAFNRRYLEKHITERYNRDITKTQTSVIVVDLDHFKMINDNYGHDCGDTVLITVVKIIKRNIRKSDYLVRLGGEEFAIILPSCTERHCWYVTALLRDAIENTPIKFGDYAIRCTASFGICTSESSEHELSTLLTEADKALYLAKHGGRNRINVANPISEHDLTKVR